MKRLKSYKLFESKFDVNQIKSIIERDCKKFIEEVGVAKFYRGFRQVERYEVMPGLYHIYNTKARSPKDTKIEVSDLLDDQFEKKFGVRPRKDAVFTTKDTVIASDYGNPFLFYPIGDYKYLYNPNVLDLFNDLQDLPWYLDDIYWWQYYGDESGNGVWSVLDYDLTDDYEESVRMAKNNLPHIEKDIKNLIRWRPEVLYEDWKKEQDLEMMEDIKDIVWGYRDSDLSKLLEKKSPEVMFLCDEYYLVNPDINIYS